MNRPSAPISLQDENARPLRVVGVVLNDDRVPDFLDRLTDKDTISASSSYPCAEIQASPLRTSSMTRRSVSLMSSCTLQLLDYYPTYCGRTLGISRGEPCEPAAGCPCSARQRGGVTPLLPVQGVLSGAVRAYPEACPPR